MRCREISAYLGLPGGPERPRTTCHPRSHIELVSEKARTAKLVGLEPVSDHLKAAKPRAEQRDALGIDLLARSEIGGTI
jgi:hypothetical protein